MNTLADYEADLYRSYGLVSDDVENENIEGLSQFSSISPYNPTIDTDLSSEMEAIQSQINLMNQSNVQSKQERLTVAAENKRNALRKDTTYYDEDNWLTESLKGLANEFLPHDYQLAVNKFGKRFNSQNKIFNEQDLSNIWDKYEDNPNGDKVLYYLRRQDGVREDGTPIYQYKPGIAHVSAADRYKAQLANSDWTLIAEKRFDEASTVEKMIHGNKEFLESRVFDYGRTSDDKLEAQQKGLAYNEFGAGKSELYNKDILGLDTKTEEEYAYNKAKSKETMINAMLNEERQDKFEFIDAFEASIYSLAGKMVKGVGELFSTGEADGALETLGKKIQEDANKIAGYNPKAMMAGAAQMKAGIREGNVFDVIAGAIKAGPQAVAGSILETGAVAGAIATGNIPLAGAALMGIISANTNDTLDEREKANGGRKATLEETTAVFLGETLATALDYASFKFVTGAKILGLKFPGSKKAVSFKEAMDKIKPSGRIEFAKALGKTLTKGTSAYASEGAQEGITEIIRTLGSTYGTDKYKGQTMTDIIQDNEIMSQIATSAVLGGAGGVTMNVPSNVMSTASQVNESLKDKQAEKNSKLAGTFISSEEDRTMKQTVAELDAEVIETTYNKLYDLQGKLETANTKEEITTLLVDIMSNMEQAQVRPKEFSNIFNTLKENLSKGKLAEVKDIVQAGLYNSMAHLSNEAKNKNIAIQALKAAEINNYTIGDKADTKVAIEDIKESKLETKKGIVKTLLSKLTSTPVQSASKARTEIETKLSKMSDKVLDNLSQEENLDTLIKEMEGKDGYNVVTKPWLQKKIDEVRTNRAYSDQAFSVNQDIGTEITSTTKVGDAIKNINESLKNYKDTEEDKANLDNNVVSLIDSVMSLPDKDLLDLASGELELDSPSVENRIGALLVSALGKGENADKAVNFIKTNKEFQTTWNSYVKPRLDKLKGVNGDTRYAKAIIRKVASAKTVLDPKDISNARTMLKSLYEKGEFTKERYDYLNSRINKVDTRSKQTRKTEREAAKKADKEKVDEYTEEVKVSEEVSETFKQQLDEANDSVRNQIYNLGSEASELEQLFKKNKIDFDKISVEEDTVLIKYDCK